MLNWIQTSSSLIFLYCRSCMEDKMNSTHGWWELLYMKVGTKNGICSFVKVSCLAAFGLTTSQFRLIFVHIGFVATNKRQFSLWLYLLYAWEVKIDHALIMISLLLPFLSFIFDSDFHIISWLALIWFSSGTTSSQKKAKRSVLILAVACCLCGWDVPTA